MNNNQENNRRPLTPEERRRRIEQMSPEERRRYEERKREYIERKKREEAEANSAKRKKIILISVFAATFALVIGLSAILIALFLHKDDPKTPDSFVYVIGDDRKDVAYKDAERDGVLCIDIRDMRKALGLTESSKSADSVTFTAKSGNSVKFSDGSAIATVNGVCDVKMPADAVVTSKICSVPIETVAYIFDGISVTLRTSRVYIEKIREVDIYAKCNETLNMIIDFEADLKDYEDYMNPTGEDRDKYLLIASKVNPLGKNFIPDELYSLEKTYCYNENANQMTYTAAKALEAMLIELWADTGDMNIVGTSGYRSYTRQETLFNNYINEEMTKDPSLSYEEAKELVLTYSAAPGTSEHQSGLCMDLVDLTRGDVENYGDTGCFTDRDTYEWLLANSWKFGFVLRYPEGKEDITGYSFESWHYRYVGRYHAERIYRSGLTLDEYVTTLD